MYYLNLPSILAYKTPLKTEKKYYINDGQKVQCNRIFTPISIMLKNIMQVSNICEMKFSTLLKGSFFYLNTHC